MFQSNSQSIVTVTRYKLPDLPVGITNSCTVTAPPDIDKYTNITLAEREFALSKLIINLYGDLNKCDNKLHNIELWYKSQKDMLKELNSSNNGFKKD